MAVGEVLLYVRQRLLKSRKTISAPFGFFQTFPIILEFSFRLEKKFSSLSLSLSLSHCFRIFWKLEIVFMGDGVLSAFMVAAVFPHYSCLAIRFGILGDGFSFYYYHCFFIFIFSCCYCWVGLRKKKKFLAGKYRMIFSCLFSLFPRSWDFQEWFICHCCCKPNIFEM